MVGKDLRKLLRMVKMMCLHFGDFCGQSRILKYNPQTSNFSGTHCLLIVSLMKCEKSLLRCHKCSAYLPNVNYSYCCTCVNYSLFQRMSSETLWDSHRKKIFDTHQKRFYFYIFASVELLLLQFLFLQISCKI